ncbi:leucine-zipper-like transcriptional regulator 1 homolog isoform X2 [Perca fluviatilis]|uniref:leucine-zipper-like transcriptional regulator 1 homolog isoform X2 n=1 Tax=Perca fluviatilis TaxID=8168 RepID=UPI00196629D2|nr:leucine-zipper-like transcriptional regulator 1 homolog isoform X2 [Perca fluviatilis]
MPAMSHSSPCLWTRLLQGSQAPCDRYKHACCSYGGHVYILGGRDSSSLRDFWRYSVAKQKWVPCQGKTSSPQSRMPTNRKGHSAVVLGSAMLVYGGLVDIKGSSQDFWSLDFDSMAWSQLNGSQQQGPLGPGPRHSHSAVGSHSCMYLFGGLKGLREQRDFWKWNSTSNMWSSLKNKAGPSRLMGHSAVAYQDSMLLYGGGESQNSLQHCLWRYNFSTQTWGQVATLPGSNPPGKIHHCCIGLGPSYKSKTSSPCSSSAQPRLLEGKLRLFKNKCFPAPLTFLGSEGAIELETFSPDRCYGSKTLTQSSQLFNSKEGVMGKDAQQIGNCLTFENKAFRKQWGCRGANPLDKEEEEEDEDDAAHLPDLLLVLGGKPCTTHSPISIWQMTLTDS